MLKRMFDLIFSIFALLILSPFFVLIALLIKFDSKGPVFFRQARVGRFGKLFDIYKFRTMNVVNNTQLQLTVANDTRITRVGFYLRKFKLDELAQFLNVLLGDMSIVGPRPEVPVYVEKYPESVRDKILSMRPGITDRASIEFRNENEMLSRSNNAEKTYINEILPVKLRYYNDYVNDNSIFGDVRIIWDTICSILIKN